MRARFHRFLLMLLMLALPLQAVASVAMLGYMVSHPVAAEHMVMADEMMAGCHEHESSDNAPAQHDCQHCAACALGTALPIPAATVPAIVPSPVRFIAHPAASFSGFIPDGPERPPRISLV